ncbi:MAG: PAS domain S-box protein [Burkholderiales bacterium]|nr:PAS domain S-box protein [Burkholderiales bacterium]
MAAVLGLAVLGWQIAADDDGHAAQLGRGAASDRSAAAVDARVQRFGFALRAADAIVGRFEPTQAGRMLRSASRGRTSETMRRAAPGHTVRPMLGGGSGPIGVEALMRGLLPTELPSEIRTLRVAGSEALEPASRSQRPLGAAAVGALTVLALGLYLRRESNRRARAVDEAARLAAEVHGRRGAEQAVRDGERRFRDVVEASPVGLLVSDPDGRIVLANPQAERLFGWGPGELIGTNIDTLLPDAARAGHAALRSGYLDAPVRRAMAPGRDLRGRHRDGTAIPLEIGLSPIRHDGVISVLATIVDRGARQAEQRQLEAMLREKTVLLDEVHHRVKNNLQVITSLLSLQARGAPPEARAALAACRNRVHAMALTHQLLHEHADVAQLHVGEYLTRLGRLLADGQRSSAPAVQLRVEGAEVPLHLELPRAIPCGLLVNELVTNAYDHAFPDERAGTVIIGIAIDGDTASIRVEDDGVGLPPGLDTEAPTSLGLQLVPLLVDQLGGTLSRGGPPGTRFEVRFPLAAEARR